MDTGSILDLVTSFDAASMTDPILGLNGVVDAIIDTIVSAISIWPAGSVAANGSLDGLFGSIGTAIGSVGGQ